MDIGGIFGERKSTTDFWLWCQKFWKPISIGDHHKDFFMRAS